MNGWKVRRTRCLPSSASTPNWPRGTCGLFTWPGCYAWRQAGGGGDPAGFENGLLTSRQLDVDDNKSGNAFKMADVRRCDAPACGDGRGGNDAVVRSDVRASRGQHCPQAGMRAGGKEIEGDRRERRENGLHERFAPGRYSGVARWTPCSSSDAVMAAIPTSSAGPRVASRRRPASAIAWRWGSVRTARSSVMKTVVSRIVPTGLRGSGRYRAQDDHHVRQRNQDRELVPAARSGSASRKRAPARHGVGLAAGSSSGWQ